MRLIHMFRSAWFLWAYVLMMALAPLVDRALEGGVGRGLQFLAPLFLTVFVWGFLSARPVLRDVLPITAGINAYSGLTLLGVYAGARVIRKVGFGGCLGRGRLLWIGGGGVRCDCDPSGGGV